MRLVQHITYIYVYVYIYMYIYIYIYIYIDQKVQRIAKCFNNNNKTYLNTDTLNTY